MMENAPVTIIHHNRADVQMLAAVNASMDSPTLVVIWLRWDCRSSKKTCTRRSWLGAFFRGDVL
jgi:hypothetical protein